MAPEGSGEQTSKEATTDRPKPFDDDDASLRKRRRTGSPLEMESDGKSAKPHDVCRVQSDSNDVSQQISMPHTSQQSSSPSSPRVGSPVSKISVPLPGQSRTTPSSGKSAQPLGRILSPSPSAPEDNEAIANSEQSLDAAHALTPTTQSSTVGMESSHADPTSRSEYLNLTSDVSPHPAKDPTSSFPYHSNGDPAVTLDRLCNYLSSEKCNDIEIITTLNDWLSETVGYLLSQDIVEIQKCLGNHLSFWLRLPELMPLLKNIFVATDSHASAEIMLDALRTLTTVTARMIRIDCLVLKAASPDLRLPKGQQCNLFGNEYLAHFVNACRCENYDESIGFDLHLSNTLLTYFSAGSIYGLTELSDLSDAIIPRLSDLPRLKDHIYYACWVLKETAQIMSVREATDQNETYLELYQVWRKFEHATKMSIEKIITHLNSNETVEQTVMLSETLNICVEFLESNDSKDGSETHISYHAPLPKASEACMTGWEWLLTRLSQLIRSSQMQLRIAAVNRMASKLVEIWSQLSALPPEHFRDQMRDGIGAHLLRIGIVDYLLGLNCHPEVTQSSGSIVGYLAINGQFSVEHMEIFWETVTTSQDPRVSNALCHMAKSFVPWLDFQGLLGLCITFQTLPIAKFTPAMLGLCFDVLTRMLDKAQTMSEQMTFHPFELCLRVLREASRRNNNTTVISPEIQQKAMSILHELLNLQSGDAEMRDSHTRALYSTCLKDISSRSDTTLGSLAAILLAVRRAATSEISELTDQHDLSRLVVEELQHAAEAAKSAGGSPILSGSQSHPRRELISYIIRLQSQTLVEPLGQELWNILVGAECVCVPDREVGWEIINNASSRKTSNNQFLTACYVKLLPALSPDCFCHGALSFVREQLLPLFSNLMAESAFDPECKETSVGLEQLWRIGTEAESEDLADRAIQTLVMDLYLESPLMRTLPSPRARSIHSEVVMRCLRQMNVAAQGLAGVLPVGADAGSPDLTSRKFCRSLRLMCYLLENYRIRPRFAQPDISAFMNAPSGALEGELTQLKYQSFDGSVHTDVKPLAIGRRNTAASLLSRLKEETGFENYRAYYRGLPFLPSEADICKSLEDLKVEDGLILVRREDSQSPSSLRIKPGSSLLEIEIAGHFDELLGYLRLAEPIAKEVYTFLSMMPADHAFMKQFEDESYRWEDFFPPTQPFKSLYTLYTMTEYLRIARAKYLPVVESQEDVLFPKLVASVAVRRCSSLVAEAITADSSSVQDKTDLELEVLLKLVAQFKELSIACREENVIEEAAYPSSKKLIGILAESVNSDAHPTCDNLYYATFSAILKLGLDGDVAWPKYANNPRLKTTIRNLLLLQPRPTLRRFAADLCAEGVIREVQLLQMGKTGNPDQQCRLIKFLWPIFSSAVADAAQYPMLSSELLGTCSIIMTEMMKVQPSTVTKSFLEVSSLMCQFLVNHHSTETIGQGIVQDVFASSVASLLDFCLQHNETISEPQNIPRHFTLSLIQRHLFPENRTSSDEPVQSVILDTKTRKTLCNIILTLSRRNTDVLRSVLMELDNLVPFFLGSNDEAYRYDLPPSTFDRDSNIISRCGYVGLRNLSNTCYLNSLMTQLYMNLRFRQFILQATASPSDSDRRLLHNTQRLFTFMQESWRASIDPEDFTSALRTFEGTSIDVQIQMDVDEFYNLLFDQFESSLSSASEKTLLRSFYGGQLVQQVKSTECDHVSERLEPFLAIQCDIKGKSNLGESLQAYVDGEVMDGDNKYKCSDCDRHVNAVKRACLKDVPDHLIFHLKRFDFNLRTLQRNKINDYFAFPTVIDMMPYTAEYLSGNKLAEPDLFELVGILVHTGTAESGHYYSYIRERPSSMSRESWLEFNDEMVTAWDPNTMEHCTFGGTDYPPDMESSKPYSAYMLFYQRASTLSSDQAALFEQRQVAPIRMPVDPALQDHILKENTVLLRRHCLFDPSHAEFVIDLCHAALQSTTGSAQSLSLAAKDSVAESTASAEAWPADLPIHVALNHLDQVIARTPSIPCFRAMAEIVSENVTGNAHFAREVAEYFLTRPEVFRSLLQRNAEPSVRKFARDLLLTCLKSVSTTMPSEYDPSPESPRGSVQEDFDTLASTQDDSQTNVLERVVYILRALWRNFQHNSRAFEDVLSFVHGFAKLGHRETALLLAEDWLVQLIRVLTADPASEMRSSYTYVARVIARRGTSKSITFSALVSLLDHLLRQLEPELGPEVIVDEASERITTGPPFAWTAPEVQCLFRKGENDCNVLFTRLIAVDQNHTTIKHLLRRFMRTGEEAETAIFNTLKHIINEDQRHLATRSLLWAVTIFIENADSLEAVLHLLNSVANQIQNMQIREDGQPCHDFFRRCLEQPGSPYGYDEDIRDECRQLVPTWAPWLLASPEIDLREGTVDLLDKYLFIPLTESRSATDFEDGGDHEDERDRDVNFQKNLANCATKLGTNCLLYLRESHVEPEVALPRAIANCLLNVEDRCYSTTRESMQRSHSADFEARYAGLRQGVYDSIQTLVTDDQDTEVADWISLGSSELEAGEMMA